MKRLALLCLALLAGCGEKPPRHVLSGYRPATEAELREGLKKALEEAREGLAMQAAIKQREQAVSRWQDDFDGELRRYLLSQQHKAHPE